MTLIRQHPIMSAVIAVAAIVLLFGGYALFGSKTSDNFEMMAVPVVLAPISEITFVDKIQGIGTAKANESLVLTAKVTETVRKVNFEDGMTVTKGDVLIELTNAEESALLAEAQANLKEAELQYNRIADLAKRGNASRAQLDIQTGLRNAAKARVDAIAARMSDRLIRAPFSGILGFRQVSPGTLVQPSTAVATLDDISIIKLDFSVPEIYIAALRPGLDIVAKSAAYPKQEFIGRVTTVDSRVDPTSRAVMVRAEVANPDLLLRSGMLITVEVIRSRDKVIAVPEQALVPVQNRQFVYTVENGSAKQIEVEIGRRRPGAVELIKGPPVGTEIVIDGLVRIRNGVPVSIKEKQQAFSVDTL